MEGRKRRRGFPKRLKSLLGRLIQIQDRPGRDEESGIGTLMRVRAAVVVDNLITQGLRFKFVVESLAKAVGLGEVERAEVKEEVPVDELRVHGEEMRFWGGFLAGLAPEGDVVEPVLGRKGREGGREGEAGETGGMGATGEDYRREKGAWILHLSELRRRWS